MQPADVKAVDLVAFETFRGLFPLVDESLEERSRRARGRIAHLLETDPGGAWVARRGDGRVIGAALALLRDDVWGLSLLVVEPTAQSGGVGRELLARALDYGAGARGGLILSSTDARALRAYARAGFSLRPMAGAAGIVDRRAIPPRHPDIEEHGLEAAPVVEWISRAIRGATYARDLPPILDSGYRLLTLADRGFALHKAGRVRVLAALDEETARALLWAGLAEGPPGATVDLEHIGPGQDWAVEVALEARLDLSITGALFVRGELGPLHPYLPSGAYL